MKDSTWVLRLTDRTYLQRSINKHGHVQKRCFIHIENLWPAWRVGAASNRYLRSRLFFITAIRFTLRGSRIAS